MKKIILFFGVICSILLLAIFSGKIKIGKANKIPQKDDVENSSFYKNYFEKEDTVVLNVWATWCKPCIAEIPQLNTIKASKSDTKIKFLSISIDKDSVALNKFLDKKEFDFQDITTDNQYYVYAILNLLEKQRTGNNFNGIVPQTYIIYKKKVIKHVLGKMEEEWSF